MSLFCLYRHLLMVAAMLLLFLVTACRDQVASWDDETELINAAGSKGYYCSFTIDLPQGSASTRTQSDTLTSGAIVTDYRGRTIDENRLTYLWIFMVDVRTVGGEEVEDWTTVQVQALARSQLMDITPSGSSTLRLQSEAILFTSTRSAKHLYVGANLSTELVRAFAAGSNTYTAPSTEGYDAVISHFVSADRGVAMFCDAPVTITTEQVIASTQDQPLKCSLSLRRMVAKVLLTANADESGQYAAISTPTNADYPSGRYAGWAAVSTLSYKLRTTNRATYFVQQHDADGQVVDPNYAVADQISWNGTEVTYRQPYGEDLTSFHFAVDTEAESFYFLTASTQANAMSVPAYSEQRVPGVSGHTDLYTVGFYCLENTCDNRWSDLGGQGSHLFWEVGPAHIVTGLTVEARYIPAVIYTRSSFYKDDGTLRDANDIQPKLFETQAEAEAMLKAESKDRLASYSSINGRYCYTGRARDAQLAFSALHPELGSVESDDFVDYIDGYGYYFDYINTYAADPTDYSWNGKQFDGVERNRYYILECTLLHVPASTGSGIKLISVGSDWTSWQYVGSSQDIYISPDF